MPFVDSQRLDIAPCFGRVFFAVYGVHALTAPHRRTVGALKDPALRDAATYLGHRLLTGDARPAVDIALEALEHADRALAPQTDRWREGLSARPAPSDIPEAVFDLPEAARGPYLVRWLHATAPRRGDA